MKDLTVTPPTTVGSAPTLISPTNPRSQKCLNLYQSAVNAIADGYYILPLWPDDKRPFACGLDVLGRKKFYNGLHSVYTAACHARRKYVNSKTGRLEWTPTQPLESWTDGHECNVGIALELSGLTVLDFDAGINDENELKDFMADFNLPHTLAVRSGRTSAFGCHLYYRGVTESDTLEIPWRGRTVKVEIKSKDKLVAGEGSYHKSGQRYTRLWNVPVETASFQNLRDLSVTRTSTAAADSGDSDSEITQEIFEDYLTANGENFDYVGFDVTHQEHRYIRTDGCPHADVHTRPNGERDFMLRLPVMGPLMAVCVHETCRAAWVALSCWKDYVAFLKSKTGANYVPMFGRVLVKGRLVSQPLAPQRLAAESLAPKSLGVNHV